MEQEKEKERSRGPRGPFQKSTVYPYYNLEDCIDFIKVIDQLGGEQVSEKTLLDTLGITTPTTRSYSGKISSSKQFGLIETKGKTISITKRGLELLHPTSDDETHRKDLLREAIQTPGLYQKLIDKFDTKKLPNEEILANIFMSDFKIAKAVKNRAAQVLFESARYAGVLTEDNILNLNPPEKNERAGQVSAEIKTPVEFGNSTGIQQTDQAGWQTLRVALSSESIAVINVPMKITRGQVDRLKKMLDLLIVENDQQNSST
jgi:hypothetical protein